MMRALATELLLAVTVVVWAVLLGGLLYETLVVVPVWTADLPRSVALITEHGVIPGAFWTRVGPPHTLLPLLAIALAWNQRERRKWLLAAAAIVVLINIMQFAYFFPRNTLMGDAATPPDAVITAGAEWVSMNRIRIVYVAVGLVATLRAFGLRAPRERGTGVSV